VMLGSIGSGKAQQVELSYRQHENKAVDTRYPTRVGSDQEVDAGLPSQVQRSLRPANQKLLEDFALYTDGGLASLRRSTPKAQAPSPPDGPRTLGTWTYVSSQREPRCGSPGLRWGRFFAGVRATKRLR